ncbi:hypothetical protein BLOT_013389 [Blomia tropicalis]|nr:hypothetical protein BLOT_013389 [Blomia tropicalis]
MVILLIRRSIDINCSSVAPSANKPLVASYILLSCSQFMHRLLTKWILSYGTVPLQLIQRKAKFSQVNINLLDLMSKLHSTLGSQEFPNLDPIKH